MEQFEDIPECTLSIGRKFYPRLYRRHKDLRDVDEAAAWARSLDWRNNPYDRFLFKREIVRQAENRMCLVAREKIAAEVEILLDEFGRKFEDGNIFVLILTALPWHLTKYE